MNFSSLKIIAAVAAGIALLFAGLFFFGSSLVPDLSGGISQGEESAAQNGDLLNARAPYFDLPGLSGDHVALSNFANKPLVVMFWATWSPQSTDALHVVDEYIASHPEVAPLVSVVTINSQEEKSLVASYMRRGGYKTQVLLDTLGKAGEAYGVKSLPLFVFIDSTGVVRSTYAGVLSEKMLGDKVESVL